VAMYDIVLDAPYKGQFTHMACPTSPESVEGGMNISLLSRSYASVLYDLLVWNSIR
jgi:hypothetical protein